MKIYIVKSDFDGENRGSDIEGAFSTREKAIERFRNAVANYKEEYLNLEVDDECEDSYWSASNDTININVDVIEITLDE